MKMKLQNMKRLAKHWKRDFEKGKEGEEAATRFLILQGFQVLTIQPHDANEDELFSTDQKVKRAAETIFAPDFLILSEDLKFFGDAKTKSKLAFLGWVNVRDYRKYYEFMRGVEGIGFRLYFLIEQTREIFVHTPLRDPEREPLFETTMQSDGECYIIPRSELELCGHFD